MIQVGSYVKTKTGKSGTVRSIYHRDEDIVLVILLSNNSCYCCPLSLVMN